MSALNASAIEKFRNILNPQNILFEKSDLVRYSQNTDAITREIPAVLFPETKEQVQSIVRIANEFRIPLYPIGCGKNWGLGSRLPVSNGSMVIDLSKMNRILEVNVEQQYAVVEPGVTQEQLYNYLSEKQIPLIINVTGSSSQTSLIGNALERGVGYFATKAESMSGMEIVLGNGQILKTGFSHFPSAKMKHAYRHGVGPSFDGLFFQSNYGIVVSAGIELIPKPESHVGLMISLTQESDFPELINRIAALRRDGVLQTVAHIAERNRTLATLGPLVFKILAQKMDSKEAMIETEHLLKREGFGPWSAIVALMGRKSQIESIAKIAKSEFKGMAKVRILTDQRVQQLEQLSSLLSFIPFFKRKQAILNAMKPVYGLSKGIPTNATLASLYWAIGEIPPSEDFDPDQSPCGMLCCLPILPAVGEIAQNAMAQIRKISAEYKTPICTTFNTIDSKSLEAVITLHFHKEKGKEQAYDCLRKLYDYFSNEGYLPYRVGIESMSEAVHDADLFWKTARDLKTVFDPNHIISPGRYNLS